MDGSWVIGPERANLDGVLIYRFSSPYPVLDGTIEIEALVQGNGALELAFSENGKVWQKVWQSMSKGKLDTTISLNEYFRNRKTRPVYIYLLKLFIPAAIDAVVRISRLSYTGEIQLAPHALPTLEKRINQVRYIDETKGKTGVEIELTYDIIKRN